MEEKEEEKTEIDSLLYPTCKFHFCFLWSEKFWSEYLKHLLLYLVQLS